MSKEQFPTNLEQALELIATLQAHIANLQTDIAALREQNTSLREQNDALRLLGADQQNKLIQAQQQTEQLANKKPQPIIKPNVSEQPKKTRRKRASEHNRSRKRETPTRIVTHSLERCPDCNYLLQGSSFKRSRQVIELPAPQPVDVIEHQLFKRWCPHCQTWHTPHLDLTGHILGKGRIGVRLASVIAYLRQTLRLPVRLIKSYLETIHQLPISIGEITELLHQVRRTLQPAIEQLKQEVLQNPIVHADETGWREQGKNGYIWAFSTVGENTTRYYDHNRSRGQAVVKRFLGDQFQGHLVSDFYAGYNIYAGQHQRCWVHLLRDLHDMKENQRKILEKAGVSEAEGVQAAKAIEWAIAVRGLYEEAQQWLKDYPTPTQEQREVQYIQLFERAGELGLTYAKEKRHPCRALCQRLMRHQGELFQFVLVEGLLAENNHAERSIRPLVVIRKVSGGSRSGEGTKTRMGLASLFETWNARGMNPFEACFQLLSTPSPLRE